MRVHRLEITAFGPFPRTEIVDFDALNDAEIFLLTGPTGAGKTTVLDAICFGLFGSVPGARNGAKDLKSHHAEPDAVPTVVLEVTLRGRRFRIRRSPAWSKPSRRATAGFVDQAAKAAVEEHAGGRWVALTARVDDVALLITRVLGMNRDQFCQVVMLPQGQFQTFLRAGAKERHDVLESLFETRRFGRIEAWLADSRRARERALEAHQAVVCHLLARAQEVGGDLDATIQASVDDCDFDPAASALVQRMHEAAAAAFDAGKADATTTTALKRAQHALDSAQELSARQRRRSDAGERLRELAATSDVVSQRTEKISRAEAARSLTPLVALLGDAERRLSAADDLVTERLSACADTGVALPRVASPECIDSLVSAQRDALNRVESMVGVQKSADDLAGRITGADRELAELETLRQARHDAASAVPKLLAEARAQLRQQTDLGATEPSANAGVAEAAECLAAAGDVARLSSELARLAGRLRSAWDQLLRSRTDWLDLRERRLDGMAAELAAQLTVGSGCPVCGSPTHPHPAVASAHQVTAEAEAAALETTRGCDEEHSRLEVLAVALRSELAVASARASGLDLAEARRRMTEANGRLDAAADARRASATLARQIAELEERHLEIERGQRELDARCRLLRERRLDDLDQLETKRADLVRALGADANVQDQLVRGRLALAATGALVTAVHEQARRKRTWDDAHSHLVSALAPTAFDGVDDVRSAAMTDADIAAADALNRSYDADVRDARRIVDDPALADVASVAEPDLAGLRARVGQLEEQRVHVRASAERLSRQRDRLEDLVERLGDALARWHPLVAERDVVAAVAAMCAGTAADNLTKTKLSHYVLAARLEQVVAAANLRLAGICGCRYQLEHSMARGVGDARGGLGLLVLDTYTGHRRDPATLSGGETFYVSLALALGLADLVRDEIGGVELSTLFVDEGFGGLDSETLDEVMDEIDSLRSGGRCVGLVSHLSELRMRIPMQLRVTATTRGSTITSQ